MNTGQLEKLFAIAADTDTPDQERLNAIQRVAWLLRKGGVHSSQVRFSVVSCDVDTEEVDWQAEALRWEAEAIRWKAEAHQRGKGPGKSSKAPFPRDVRAAWVDVDAEGCVKGSWNR